MMISNIMSTLLLAILITSPLLIPTAGQKIIDEREAKRFLEVVERKLEEKTSQLWFAHWNFNTNINEENQNNVIKTTAIYNKFLKELWTNVSRFDFSHFQDYDTKRQFEKLSVLGIAALHEKDSNQFTKVSKEMERIYSSASVCVRGKCGLELQPDLVNIMSKSRDYEELKETWTQWRNSAGKPVRELYKQYVELGNKAAVINGFKTLDDLWLFPWETNDFKEQMETLWQEIEPIYKKLHTYVRVKLRQHYGTDKMPNDGTIPAHLLGNMWAQSWHNILDLVVPFPHKNSIDVTNNLRNQNYTALKMFGLSDKFFRDLGLLSMPLEFWWKSIITKPKDRKFNCSPYATDFYNKRDFRVQMCTDITMEDLNVIHHEMGHIQYYLQYKNQPVVFRDGANQGFHEAIGDFIALSVTTPAHLNKIGLLDPLVDDYETTLNYQMKIALEKIAFLPFSYVMDNWRWDVFSGKTSNDDLNKHWWELRIKYEGISPPVKRSEQDFDPGAKFHIPAGIEYIRYFVSHIIQFQFHKALCNISQPNVPLYKCDIDGNKAAGERLAQVMRLGMSKPWPEQMQILTGDKHMSAQPLIEYFEPLLKYLDEQIKDEKIGWTNNVDNYMESSNNSTKFDRLESRLIDLEKKDQLLSRRLHKLENDLKDQQKAIDKLKTKPITEEQEQQEIEEQEIEV